MTTDGLAVRESTGNVVHWDGGCLFIGTGGGVAPLHAHYAIQIAFGPQPGIRFRADEDAAWTSYDGAIVPSRQPHSMDASLEATGIEAWAVLFVEPETREGRTLAELHLRDGIAPIPTAALAGVRERLFEAWSEGLGSDALVDASWRVIEALTGGIEPSVASDERILRAIAYINSHLGAPLTLDAVAAEACLSPGRFRHLFVEETGMGLRPYILWRRFLGAWKLVAAGASLSTAAHAAGFADAAHLSRTSRRMFGFPPSAMQVTDPIRKSAPPFNWPRHSRREFRGH